MPSCLAVSDENAPSTHESFDASDQLLAHEASVGIDDDTVLIHKRSGEILRIHPVPGTVINELHSGIIKRIDSPDAFGSFAPPWEANQAVIEIAVERRHPGEWRVVLPDHAIHREVFVESLQYIRVPSDIAPVLEIVHPIHTFRQPSPEKELQIAGIRRAVSRLRGHRQTRTGHHQGIPFRPEASHRTRIVKSPSVILADFLDRLVIIIWSHEIDRAVRVCLTNHLRPAPNLGASGFQIPLHKIHPSRVSPFIHVREKKLPPFAQIAAITYDGSRHEDRETVFTFV